jgi:uncharacterized membrane protein
MQEKKLKIKDMIIAIFCTILAVLCIVFYFLPAFNIKHSTSPMMEYEVVNYSGWEMTRAAFASAKVIGFNWSGLTYIKEVYGFAVILSGVLMPLSIVCSIGTTVFAYLSWLKTETFKKFCFLFSLVGMLFQTISLVLIWFIAIMSKDGNHYNFFNNNIKGGMSYGAFVSLILVFVIAIIACAYNYFLENFDDEDEEDEEDDDEEEEIEYVVRKRKKKIVYIDVDEDEEEEEEVKPKKTTPKSTK